MKFNEIIKKNSTTVMNPDRNGRQRGSIRVGITVDIIQKADQRTNKKTRGIVQEILTSSLSHPHGIKVRLKDGQVGRVTEIISEDDPKDILKKD